MTRSDLGPQAPVASATRQPPAGFFKLGENGSDADIPSPRVEGRIPDGLKGVLYRNGPGMFERNGYKKRTLLDGDGFVQRLAFADGKASYRARFVRTPKFLAEEAAGRFLYPTWTTRAPGGPLANLPGRFQAQAGVTINTIGGRLLAMDEAAPLFEVGPETLETLGSIEPGRSDMPFTNKAHVKADPITGRTVLAGGTFGRVQKLHVVERGPGDAVVSHRIVADAPNVYIHDFFLTRTKVMVLLHPTVINPLSFLLGLKDFRESVTWTPERGGKLLIVDREGDLNPVWIDVPAVFMWHALNAYERADGRIVADFVGYAAPEQFFGKAPQLEAYMQGRLGESTSKGRLLRWVIDPARRTFEQTVLSEGNLEFPMVDDLAMAAEHRVGYFAAGGIGVLNTGVARIDVETGKSETFDFGPDMIAGEPIFARDPSASDERGWLLQQVLDGARGETFFSVIRSDAVADGPVARIEIGRHAPISFHGNWTAA